MDARNAYLANDALLITDFVSLSYMMSFDEKTGFSKIGCLRELSFTQNSAPKTEAGIFASNL